MVKLGAKGQWDTRKLRFWRTPTGIQYPSLLLYFNGFFFKLLFLRFFIIPQYYLERDMWEYLKRRGGKVVADYCQTFFIFATA